MPLDDSIVAKLDIEIQNAKKAKHAYDSFIKPYIDAKTEQLFEAFKGLKLSNTEELMEVKRMLAAIEGLDNEIKSVITTGTFASRQLEMNEETK